MTEKLNRAAELLHEKGIDYRIIGSKALQLYTEIDERIGDIDLLVPRADIRAIPEIRKKLKQDFGRTAVLGTYPSMKVINFTSYRTSLEYRDIHVPLDASTMQEISIDGVKTVSPESLIGMYGTIGIDREKDAGDIESLRDISHGEVDPAFDEFKELRSGLYPMYTRTRAMKDVLLKPIPKKARLLAQDVIESGLEKNYRG
jgi:predicted nucleotidyltransferase